MQVAKENMPVSSIVIGVDLYPIKSINGCISLVEDITTDKCRTSLKKELQTWKADVVLHDGAPNVGKNWLFDAYQQICLTLQATKLASEFLRSGGWFITKVFRSKDYNALLWVLKQLFKKVHATKPSASRKESAEIFVVCQYFIAPDKIDQRFFEPKYVFEEMDLEGTKTVSLLHPEKKRIKAEGYTEKDFSLRHELKASEFIKNVSALSALQGVSEIIFDDDKITKHAKTSNEIRECCKDIKVLGRKDLKNLIGWWKALRAEFYPKEIADNKNVETIDDTEQKKQPLTQDEIEDLEFEEIEKQIEELQTAEQKDQKRKKKKVQEARRKLNEKINLKMIIKGDAGPQEEDVEVFSLSQIHSAAQLDDIQDVTPDMYLPENENQNSEYLAKYTKYDRGDFHLDDDGLYADEDNNQNELSDNENSDSDASENLNKKGLGFDESDNSETESTKPTKQATKKSKQTNEQNPLLMDLDTRDKSTKRDQRVNLWFDKDKFKELDESEEDDEEYDLNKLSNQYKEKGVQVLGESVTEKTAKPILGKKAKRRQRHLDNGSDGNNTTDDSSDSENDDMVGNTSATKAKKIKLNEQELALGAMMIQSSKTKRDLFDAAWNRYTFNDENLPEWFVQDEAQHMVKEAPVPKELTDEYQNKVNELNIRPIKKVMEAKARKKRRAMKRFEKAKKKAEAILEGADSTSQDKMRQIRKYVLKLLRHFSFLCLNELSNL